MPIVLGLDVCKDRVVCCLLTSKPSDPRQLYYDHDFYEIPVSTTGIKQILSFGAAIAVMEPTGVNYSKIWVSKLIEAGIQVFLVGHRQLKNYRISLDLPDKDDPADALALACYWFDYGDSPRRFVRLRDPVIAEMRDLVLRLQHLNRVQSPVINRLRQDLIWQFPEVAKRRLDSSVFWGWLAGERKSARYDRLYAESCGLGIEQYTRDHAKLLCDLHHRENAIERRLRELLKDDRFAAYREVFRQFGFGERIEAMVLSQIYPLENYLKDGEPEIRVLKSKRTGKPTKRHLSLRRFCKALGVSPEREDSGDNRKTKKAGSTLCRTALWQWCFTRFEVRDAYPKSAIGEVLLGYWEYEKDRGPIRLARSRFAARAVKLLFKELCRSL